MAVASLVLGIIGLVFAFIPAVGWVGAILGIVGIILGVLGRKSQPEKKGMAIAGLVMSIIAVVLGAIMFIACVACTSLFVEAAQDADAFNPDAWNEFANLLESALATGG